MHDFFLCCIFGASFCKRVALIAADIDFWCSVHLEIIGNKSNVF